MPAAAAPRSFRVLLHEFSDLSALARAIGEQPSTVRSWATRDSIPPRVFDALAAYARDTGRRRVTLKALKAADAAAIARRAEDRAQKRLKRQRNRSHSKISIAA